MAKLKITTESYTAVTSGEGTGIIDSDIVYDTDGFPFIPAKRVKGLLRESVVECLEILNISGTELLENIFGSESAQGKLHFSNLFIENYPDIKKEFDIIKSKFNTFYGILSRENILSYYTSIRQQTAIDQNGIAKEHSLRTIRVIKPEVSFEGEIDVSVLNDSEKVLIYLATKNLRKLGLNRNAGFGKVKCCLENIGNIENTKKSPNIDNIINSLKDSSINIAERSSQNIQITNSDYKPFVEPTENITIHLKITTLSPVLLSTRSGDLNTTDTRLYIPGTTIRGFFARILMDKLGLNENNAHQNSLFKQCFIEDKISFGPALPFYDEKVFYPFPSHLQSTKNNENDIYDIFGYETNELTRPIGGFVYVSENKCLTHSVPTRAYFHGSRDRITGKNEDGSIFYYDSIEPNNEFISSLTGPKKLLDALFLDQKEWIGYIGRSKTSQYGKVKIEIYNNIKSSDEFDFSGEDKIVLSALSPIILVNEQGEPDLSIQNIKNYIQFFIPSVNFEIKNIYLRTENVDFFNNTWGTKSKTYIAIKEGSSFLLKFTNNNPSNNELQNIINNGIGEFTHLGYGRVNFYRIFDETLTKKELKANVNISNIKIDKSKDILLKIIDNEYKKIIEFLGMNNANHKKPNISPSLCGRMISSLQQYTNQADFIQDFIENSEKGIKGKKAYEQLEKADLIDDMKSELYKLIENYNEMHELNQFVGKLIDVSINIDKNNIINKYYFNYWIAFFKQVRLNQKEKIKI